MPNAPSRTPARSSPKPRSQSRFGAASPQPASRAASASAAGRGIAEPAISGERSFLQNLQAAAASTSSRSPHIVSLGIGDDCAILRPPLANEVVVTTDLFLEKVHFRRDWHPPESAGHRCLARGLSDVAAMGAQPQAAFLSLALPPELAGSWITRFLDGLLRLAEAHGVVLAGGDTARPAPATPRSGALFSADIVLIGTAPTGHALLRSGARAGDRIYVTGALGGAAAELASLAAEPARYRRKRKAPLADNHPHLYPAPRIAAGLLLRRRATAAIDLSDGLSTDLAHLCTQSNVGARIDASALPFHTLARKAAKGAATALQLALNGGEDYELLFTAPPRRRIPATLAGVPVHRIGAIVPAHPGRSAITLVEADGTEKPLENGGWEHFRSKRR